MEAVTTFFAGFASGDTVTIGTTIGVIALVAIGGYLWWAYTKKEWPFS